MTAIPPRVTAVLREQQTLVLATVDGSGQPEAASIFYAPEERPDGLTLVAALLDSSAKLAHLREDARAAVYIGPQSPTRWLQATCVAAIVETDEERAHRLAQLVAAAPGARVFVERVPVAVVLFTVTRLKLTDLTGERPPVLLLDLAERGGATSG